MIDFLYLYWSNLSTKYLKPKRLLRILSLFLWILMKRIVCCVTTSIERWTMAICNLKKKHIFFLLNLKRKKKSLRLLKKLKIAFAAQFKLDQSSHRIIRNFVEMFLNWTRFFFFSFILCFYFNFLDKTIAFRMTNMKRVNISI